LHIVIVRSLNAKVLLDMIGSKSNLQIKNAIGILCAIALSSGCGYVSDKWTPDEDPTPRKRKEEVSYDYTFQGSILGEGGLSLFGEKNQSGGGGGGIGVNSFLWRATLDTIAFLPITTADAFGGVILTDWHTPPETKDERFKLNIYILGKTLRADGVRVAVFRQIKQIGGTWHDAKIDSGTGLKIENAILTRARMLRHEALKQ